VGKKMVHFSFLPVPFHQAVPMMLSFGKSDGSNSGTIRVADIYLETAARSHNFYGFNNALYFLADNGSSGMKSGRQTEPVGGTQLLKDIYPGSASAFATNAGGSFAFARCGNIMVNSISEHPLLCRPPMTIWNYGNRMETNAANGFVLLIFIRAPMVHSHFTLMNLTTTCIFLLIMVQMERNSGNRRDWRRNSNGEGY
jgi:hypothetical protein